MDPLMGILGAILITKWSVGLLKASSQVLLDAQAPVTLRQEIVDHIEEDSDNRVADLHVWSIGPGIYASEVALVTHHPKAPAHYKSLIPSSLPLVHVTVEVHECQHEEIAGSSTCITEKSHGARH